jgi:hypothetical protein
MGRQMAVRYGHRRGWGGARRTRSGPREGGWSGAREWRATEQGGRALLRAGSRWRRAAQERERGEKRGEREGGKAARDGAPLYSRGVFRWQKGGHAGSGRLIGRRNSQVLSGLIRLLNPVTAPLIVGWQANIQPWPKRLYIWRPPGAGLYKNSGFFQPLPPRIYVTHFLSHPNTIKHGPHPSPRLRINQPPTTTTNLSPLVLSVHPLYAIMFIQLHPQEVIGGFCTQ